MKNLRYSVFGPKNINEATKKIVEAKPKKVNIKLEQRLNGNILNLLNENNLRVNLNIEYSLANVKGETDIFDFTLYNAYNFGDSYGGDKKKIQKIYGSLKKQIKSLREQGILVISPLDEKDFGIILKDNSYKKK